MTLPSGFVEGLKKPLLGLGLVTSCIISVQAAQALDPHVIEEVEMLEVGFTVPSFSEPEMPGMENCFLPSQWCLS